MDDNDEVLKVARMFLGAKGFDVYTSESPFGVANLVRDRRPDAVVLDVMLPALSGADVAGILTRQMPNTPVLFYSAVDQRTQESLERDHPTVPFVSKTKGPRGLYEALSAAIGESQPRQTATPPRAQA